MTIEEAKETFWSNGHGDSNWIIDKIFDEHEVQLKEKDEEIEKLKSIIEEAIKKPMGVEPHSWSDYKMQKDNA